MSFPVAALELARVVDGDTIRVGSGQVRIMGLDAPEMRGHCPAEIAAARRAKDRMAELIAGGVTLRPRGRDRYRRLLAVVEDSRGRDMAAVMTMRAWRGPMAARGDTGGVEPSRAPPGQMQGDTAKPMAVGRRIELPARPPVGCDKSV